MQKLRMNLFGTFTLTSDTAEINGVTLRSKKVTQFLVYLLLNREKQLTQQDIIGDFWGDGGSGNPEGALKNLVHRLRTALKLLGDEDYILTFPGAYQWNPDIEVETDYEEYERLTSGMRKMTPETPDEDRKQLCRKITELYRGNIVPLVADEPWILSRVIWYRTVYIDTVKMLSRIYEKEESWAELEQLCGQALRVDMLDEDLYSYQIKALYGQKKYDVAIFWYEKAEKLFSDNVGIHSLKTLDSVFRRLMAERQDGLEDLHSFIKELSETDSTQTAFCCDYQVFRQIYQIEARRVDRMGVAGYLMMLRVQRYGGVWTSAENDQSLMEGAEILGKLVRKSLRSGDVVTQYSPTQYLVLLPACTYESGTIVARRILKQFKRSIGTRKLELVQELAEISPAGSGEEQKESRYKGFRKPKGGAPEWGI